MGVHAFQAVVAADASTISRCPTLLEQAHAREMMPCIEQCIVSAAMASIILPYSLHSLDDILK